MCTMNGQKMRDQEKGIDTGSIKFSDAKTAVEKSFNSIQEKYQKDHIWRDEKIEQNCLKI